MHLEVARMFVASGVQAACYIRIAELFHTRSVHNVCSARRAKAPATLAADGEHAATIRVLAFDSAGAWLLSADDSKTARLWRTADWTVAHTL